MKDQLAAHLRKFATAPFLFVGSGLSRRYLSSETWEELLRRFAGLTAQPYDYYRATAGGDLPQVASEIASAFHEVWWRSPDYEESRRDYAAQASTIGSALKIEISKYLLRAAKTRVAEPMLIKEVETLQKAVVDGVITTNWDPFLNEVFPDFHPFIGQDQLLFSAHHGIGEIYKIHGCASQPNSLVLTSADYQRFNERNAYLAAKLMTIFVEHPIIFLGYSLADRNVAQILRGIGACLTSANIHQLRDRLIFVSWDPSMVEPVISSGNVVIPDGFSIPILEIRTAALFPVFECLTGLSRAFPAKVLRQLKEHVYTLVKDNDPKGKLYVKDIDDSTGDSDVEVVFGVGAISAVKSVGYRGLTRNDLIEDILDEKGDFDSKRVVLEALPRLLKQNRYLPVFRYLRLAGYLKAGAVATPASIDRKVLEYSRSTIARYQPSKHYRAKAATLMAQHKTFDAVAKSLPAQDVVMYATAFPEAAFDAKTLLEFLKANRVFLTNRNLQTQFVKLVCLYDWLANRGRAA